MKFEANIDRDIITETLEIDWGITTSHLEFLPLGEEGWVYKATDEDDNVWFVKVKLHIKEAGITVPSYLNRKQHLDFILSAIPNKYGSFHTQVDEYFITVYPFITARELMNIPNKERFDAEIGKKIAALHTATSSIPSEMLHTIPKETFDSHQARSQKVIARTHTPQSSDIETELAQFITSKSEEIRKIQQATMDLGTKLSSSTVEFVVCHSDIHYANILVDERDNLFFVDWDGIILAPPERDLVFYSDDLSVKKDFLNGYDPDYQVHQETIAYYKLEWVLQEIADYGSAVFFEDVSQEQKEYALQEFKKLFEPGDVVEDALNQETME